MISLRKCDDVESLVDFFYSKETLDWHKNIHKNKGDLSGNVRATVDSMADCEVWVVELNDKFAAFFGIYKGILGECLVGFHVLKEFRNGNFLDFFWGKVKSMFSADFYTGIYEHNLPAIKHLIKQGFELVNKTEDNYGTICIFKFKK